MDTAVIDFINENTGECVEIEVPLSITANDLINALNSVYDLGLNKEDYSNYYMCMENPTVFFRGERTLEELGLRNGSRIIYKR